MMTIVRRCTTQCASVFSLALLGCLIAQSAQAQTTDTTTKKPPVPVVRADSSGTGKAVAPQPAAVRAQQPRPAAVGPQKPPITPKRAFLYSLMVPGLGQSRLDRGAAGALFAAIELGSIAMLRKTAIDLHEARRFSRDSLPNDYLVQADGTIGGTGTFPNLYPIELVNTRRLHNEDWIAALIFNHLIAGADAFVAAQLWDTAPKVSVRSQNDRVALVATLRW